jgi:hypothetical protein
VPNASVIVSGGTVSSENGFAINITGANSTVTVSGTAKVSTTATSSISSRHAINAEGANSEITITDNAEVSATAGYAINTVTNATNAKVVVDGHAKVSSATNRAINTMSANSTVEINGISQVWTFSNNSAVYSNGAVTLNGGFVFAHGTNANNVVHAATTPAVPSGSNTLVVAWNPINHTYRQGNSSSLNPDLSHAYNGEDEHFWWHNIPPYRAGISYDFSGNTGFFYIPGVAVVNDFGLIFDALTGNMYYDIDGTHTLSLTNLADPYPADATWTGVAGKLTLDGFSWSTGAVVALTIVNGNVTIELADNSTNYFASHPFSTATSFGISTTHAIEITGDGMITAFGSTYGISCSALTIVSGIVEASGGNNALSGTPPAILPTPTLPAAYTYWENRGYAVPPSGMGAQRYFHASALGSVPFIIPTPPPVPPPAIRYVKIVSGAFALVDNTKVSGEVWKSLPTATEQAIITLYGTTFSGTLTNTDVSDWFTDLPTGIKVTANSIDATNIKLTFSGTPAVVSDATFDITIPQTALNGTIDLHVVYNPNALFDITPYVVTMRPDVNGIFYVKEDGTGNGSSWADAYPNVADPLLLAAKQHSGAIPVEPTDIIREIWVAEGTYYPMHNADGYNMAAKTFLENTPDNPDNAFVLVKDVQLYGGFPENANDTDHAPHGSFTREDALNTRNWNDNPTILSGDIGIPNDNTDNCYHVVISAGEIGTACIDGFFITDGYARTYVGAVDVIVNSMTIERGDGGGIHLYLSSPILTHLTIVRNRSNNAGGGILNRHSSPIITNVMISGNRAIRGGGIYTFANIDPSIILLTNVTISGNSATSGGGIYTFANASSFIFLTNVTISGNSASNQGGGIYNFNSTDPRTLRIRNSIIWGNQANESDHPNVHNAGTFNATFIVSSLVQRNSGTGGAWDF